MIRFLFRFIGLICLAAAFLLVIYDGIKSIVDSRLSITKASTLLELFYAGGLAKLRLLLEPYAGGLLWDPVMVSILAAPGCALFGGFGILLLLLGRRKKPLIGFER